MVIFILCLIIFSVLIWGIKCNILSDTIYKALIEIKELQTASEYNSFSAHLTKLEELSKRIPHSSPKIDKAKTIAQKKYLRTHITLTKRQKDFIQDTNTKSNHKLIALLKSRFFITLCEETAKQISESTSHLEKTDCQIHITQIATDFIQYLEEHKHIGLANNIRSDAKNILGIDLP